MWLKFEVCKKLRNHLELLPKTGYIQPHSTFSAQLKYLPRKRLATEAGQYFDAETGVLQAPMTIRVADQTRRVPFTVHAVVTTSDLEFDTQTINFYSAPKICFLEYHSSLMYNQIMVLVHCCLWRQ